MDIWTDDRSKDIFVSYEGPQESFLGFGYAIRNLREYPHQPTASAVSIYSTEKNFFSDSFISEYSRKSAVNQ